MNNRQAGGRRRGRNNNNNRNQGNRGGGGVDRENRIDNRARGNAAQMLDKYKKMAQDAQVNGDRVNAEYYHQFADHYFRVNADSQARREEQRLAREEQRNQNTDRDDRSEQEDGERQDRSSRSRQQRDRGAKQENAKDAAAPTSQEDGQADVPDEKKPVRARRSRKPAADVAEANGEANGLDASALPPAISIKSDDSADKADGEAEKKPVRKRRTVKAKTAEAEAAQEGDAA